MPELRWGLTLPFAGVPLADHEPLVRRVEAAGYDDLWTGETNGADGFTPLTLAAATNQAIILRNHGLLTTGRTVAEAFIRFWRLNRACEIQLAAQAAKLRLPSPEVCEASFAMGEEFLTDQADLGQLEFDSILRKVEAKDASYKN